MLENLAIDYGIGFVDPSASFVGRELELTYIDELAFGLPNFHTNDAGYQLLADQIIAAIPTPGAAAVFAFAGATASRRRRR